VPMRFFLHVFDDTVRQTNSKNKCNCYYGFLIPVKFSVMDGWMDGWTDSDCCGKSLFFMGVKLDLSQYGRNIECV